MYRFDPFAADLPVEACYSENQVLFKTDRADTADNVTQELRSVPS